MGKRYFKHTTKEDPYLQKLPLVADREKLAPVKI